VRRKGIVVAAAFLVALGLPAPAHALWGGGWLERLSGPGPFRGQVWDQRLLCVTLKDKAKEAAGALQSDGWTERLTPIRKGRVWFGFAGCSALDLDHPKIPEQKNAERNSPRLEIGFDLELLHSTDNVLSYNQSASGPADVGLRMFTATLDVRVNRVVDVGTAFGGAWFRSTGGTPFDSFSKGVWQPMRMTVRPLAFAVDDRRAEVLSLRFEATKFSGTFTAEEFGADPGTFREPGEITWAWSIRVDPFVFLK
jgi:hypothetical protein